MAFVGTFLLGIEASPARDDSEACLLITKSRRWWQNGSFPVTFQSTGIRNTGGNAIVRGEAESMGRMLVKRSEVHLRKVSWRIIRKFS